eukprot:sb/3476679/
MQSRSQEPTDTLTTNQNSLFRSRDHGYQPIRDQYFLIWSVPATKRKFVEGLAGGSVSIGGRGSWLSLGGEDPASLSWVTESPSRGTSFSDITPLLSPSPLTSPLPSPSPLGSTPF